MLVPYRESDQTVTPAEDRQHHRAFQLTRRGFVLGGTSAGLLAACGLASTDSAPSARPQLVSLFSSDHVIAAGVPQRIPFAVVDIGDLDLGESAEVLVTVRTEDEVLSTIAVTGRVVDHDHPSGTDDGHEHADLLRYYALRAELPTPGIYDLEVEFGQGAVGTLPVQAFDTNDIRLPLIGDSLPPIATPTFGAPEGISPLCTRAPEPCPFHTDDVADLLAAGQPIALLVATPALCRTAYCGPVLETLIAEAPDFPDVSFVHLEVYANAEDVDGNYDDPTIELAKPVLELGLEFEPSLFVVDEAGVVVDRIDNIFDRDELHEALEGLKT